MIMSGPRVGVSLEADRPWRFWVAGSRCVRLAEPARLQATTWPSHRSRLGRRYGFVIVVVDSAKITV